MISFSCHHIGRRRHVVLLRLLRPREVSVVLPSNHYYGWNSTIHDRHPQTQLVAFTSTKSNKEDEGGGTIGIGGSRKKKHALQQQRQNQIISTITDEEEELLKMIKDDSDDVHSNKKPKQVSSRTVIESPSSVMKISRNLTQLDFLQSSTTSTIWSKHDTYNTSSLQKLINETDELEWKSNKQISYRNNLLHLKNSIHDHNNNHNDDNNNDDDRRLFRLDELFNNRETMFDPTIHLPYAPQDWKGYEPATPLFDFLMQRIGVSGQPITVAEYMKHALTHPLYGYYTATTKKYQQQLLSSNSRNVAGDDNYDDDDDDWDHDDDNDDYGDTRKSTSSNANCSSSSQDSSLPSSPIFGRSGDFITAPELTSLFGHCLCFWFMTIWQQAPWNHQNQHPQQQRQQQQDIQLVELGPGRGTLMADILQLAHSSTLQHFGKSIRTVHLVESSPELQREQQNTLQRTLGHLINLQFCGCATNDNKNDNELEKKKKNSVATKENEKGVADGTSSSSSATTPTTNNNNNDTSQFVNTIHIYWHSDFSSFQHSRDENNQRIPTMIIAQEFFDALPVHQFQKTENGWRERMIDVVSVEDGRNHNNNNSNHNAQSTTSTTTLVSNDQTTSSSSSNNKMKKKKKKQQLLPRLRQVLAPHVTPAVELLLQPNLEQYNHLPVGSVIEICPTALLLMQDIAMVLKECNTHGGGGGGGGGAALIVDYGEDGSNGDTLRAFSKQKQVPFTSRPGMVDITADVDFYALKQQPGLYFSSSNNNQQSNHLASISRELLDENGMTSNSGTTIPTLSTSNNTNTTNDDDDDDDELEVQVFGPVPQGEFLMKMGIAELATHAIEKPETSEEEAQAIYDALQYLVLPEHMGTKFKVLSLVATTTGSRKNRKINPPPGME